MLPVVPAVFGEPAPGFVVGRRTAEPATVKVIGPESHVRALAEATTEPVNIAGSRDRVRDVVTVGVTDAAVRLDSSVSATVLVEILPAPVEREVAGVPIRWRNLGGGMRRAGGAFGREGERARPAGGAGGVCERMPLRRSWTLPGWEPAGTICEFRSIRPSTSDSTRSRPASSK